MPAGLTGKWLLPAALVPVAMLVACGGRVADSSAVLLPEPTLEASPIVSGLSPTASATVTSLAPNGAAAASVAPDLVGITGWINSDPLTLADLKGRVVLLDFWTYTCVNCIRTFPFLREWHSKYAESGLVIVGVHTPEFEFEQRAHNVRAAAEDYDLAYPIAQDNGYATWTAFNVQAWPTKVLIGPEGQVEYRHRGEGGYDETELKIRELLQKAGANLDDIPISTHSRPPIDPLALAAGPDESLTRELYGGFIQGVVGGGAYVLNREYYAAPNQEIYYRDPGQRLNNFVFLEGVWRNGPESLTHARETQEYEDYIGIEFFAKSVNIVMRPDGEPSVTVKVTLDGRPLTQENRGADIFFDDSGDSFVSVDASRMYRLVELPEFGGHELLLSSNSAAFALYAFTFGAYTEGP